MVARRGDHLATPFQCSLCHFRNMQHREPLQWSVEDRELLDFITRAILDSFWARERSTVAKILQEGIRMERTMDRFKLPSVTPPMGPFPLEDVWGMKAAVAVLDRSFDPGLYEKTVQWETFRKLRSAVTVITQSGAEALQDVIGSYEKSRIWISRLPTHSHWFVNRFLVGLKQRHGAIVRQDWELPIDVLHEVHNILDIEWQHATTRQSRILIAQMGVLYVVGFCTAIRGEEALLIELAGTANSLRYLHNSKNPHFHITVAGRTKGNRSSGSKFDIPCVATTHGTHLRPGLWISRLVHSIHESGRTTGRLFQRKLKPAQLCEWEDNFFNLLERVQATTELIDDDLDLRQEAGLKRTLRRGVTQHALNMSIDEKLVKAISRWRFETDNRSGYVGITMIDRYTNISALKPMFLRFSDAL